MDTQRNKREDNEKDISESQNMLCFVGSFLEPCKHSE